MPSGNRARRPGERPPLVTLTTDFGTADAFVASMKGVILAACPEAVLVDVTHDVPPHDVRRGALVLRDAVPHFPPGTVHVAVVDPGVGTSRRAVAVQAGGAWLVGPDNGLLPAAAAALGPIRRVVVLPTPAGASSTFHGRDVFAPAAARLAAGDAPPSLGKATRTIQPSALPEPRRSGRRTSGEVALVDRFGNLVTNIPAGLLPAPPARCTVRIGRTALRGLRATYGDARPGETLALIESTGHVEIAVREGSAAARLHAQAGTPVEVSG